MCIQDNKGPLVSVIIPAYNAEASIQCCLESVLCQSYTRLEIIVVDDGSVDDTYGRAISLAAEDERVRVVRQPNRGVSAARNAALGMAEGEWVAFVDADDTIHPLFVACMLRKAVETGVDICCCGYRCCRGSMVFETASLNNCPDVLAGDSLFEKVLLDEPKGFLCNKLFRCSLFDRVSLDEELVVCEDLVAVLSVMRLSPRMACVHEALYSYNIGGGATFDYSKLISANRTWVYFDIAKRIEVEFADTAEKRRVAEIVRYESAMNGLSHLLPFDNYDDICRVLISYCRSNLLDYLRSHRGFSRNARACLFSVSPAVYGAVKRGRIKGTV